MSMFKKLIIAGSLCTAIQSYTIEPATVAAIALTHTMGATAALHIYMDNNDKISITEAAQAFTTGFVQGNIPVLNIAMLYMHLAGKMPFANSTAYEKMATCSYLTSAIASLPIYAAMILKQ